MGMEEIDHTPKIQFLSQFLLSNPTTFLAPAEHSQLARGIEMFWIELNSPALSAQVPVWEERESLEQDSLFQAACRWLCHFLEVYPIFVPPLRHFFLPSKQMGFMLNSCGEHIASILQNVAPLQDNTSWTMPSQNPEDVWSTIFRKSKLKTLKKKTKNSAPVQQ